MKILFEETAGWPFYTKPTNEKTENVVKTINIEKAEDSSNDFHKKQLTEANDASLKILK